MSYYIRYATTDNCTPTLEELGKGLTAADPRYEIDGDVIVFDDEDYGLIEINKLGDGTFEDDIDLLQSFAAEKKNKQSLLAVLHGCKSMVTVQPIWEDRDEDATLSVLKPLWNWLYANHPGLLIGEGGDFITENDELIE